MTDYRSDAVLMSVARGVGSVILNRPHVINALNLEMVRSITDLLVRWARDERVKTVVLRGAGPRGFCAGGDLQPEDTDGDAFLRAEYALDVFISEYPKPVVSLMNGIVLGGGVGLGAHASLRVVTEDTRIGMPETRIGICPDVGGTKLLAQAPLRIGELKALASATMTPAETLAFGFADYYLERSAFDSVVAELRARDGEDPGGVLAALDVADSLKDVDVPTWVEEAFSAGDAAEVVARLEGGPADAQAAAARIRDMSPTAVSVTLRLVRDASSLSLREALQREYDVLSVLSKRPDLAEGIRARIIDRDTPQWEPGRLEDVEQHDVERILAARSKPLVFRGVPLRVA